MLIKLRNFTFAFFAALIVIELTCAMINLIILEKSIFYKDESEAFIKINTLNIIMSCSGAFISLLSLIIIIVFGVHALYFKVKFKLVLYMIL